MLGLAAVLVAALVLACSSDEPPPLPSPPSPAATSGVTTPPVRPTDAGGPPTPSAAPEEPPTPCGIEFIVFSDAGTNPEARECLLESFQRGSAAQFLAVPLTPAGDGITQLLTVSGGRRIDVVESRFDGFVVVAQQAYTCSSLAPASTEVTFELSGCSAPSSAAAPIIEVPEPIVMCGVEVIVHSLDHVNRAARQCLLDAAQAGTPAQLFTTSLTEEGGSISEIITAISPGHVAVYRDSRDGFGVMGRFTFSCATLNAAAAPYLFALADCTEPVEIDAPGASAGASPRWLERDRLPARLDVTDVPSTDDETWLFVDPETGGWRAPSSISEQTPLDPTGVHGRYWLVRSPDGPEGPGVEPYPLELRAAVLDSTNGDVWNIGPAWAGAVSPDGTLAAVIPEAEGQTLEIVEVPTRRIDLGEFGKPVFLAWSADNVLAIVRGGTVYLASAPDWTPRAAGAILSPRVAWSPGGDRIAFFDADGLYVSDPDLTDRRLVEPMAPHAPGRDPSLAPINQRARWSPDGSRIAFTTGTAIHVVDVGSGDIAVVTPDGIASFDTSFFWSPDGDRLALIPIDQVHRGIAVAFADGSGAYQLTEGRVAYLIGWTDRGIIAVVSPGR